MRRDLGASGARSTCPSNDGQVPCTVPAPDHRRPWRPPVRLLGLLERLPALLVRSPRFA